MAEFYLDGIKKGEKTIEVPPTLVKVDFATPPHSNTYA